MLNSTSWCYVATNYWNEIAKTIKFIWGSSTFMDMLLSTSVNLPCFRRSFAQIHDDNLAQHSSVGTPVE